jgi:O-antigen ligase
VLRFATAFVAVVVGLAPLFLGGNRPVLWAVNGISAGLALVLTGIALNTRHGQQINLDFNSISLAVLAGLFLILWILFQLLPWGAGGPGHPAWGVAADLLNEPVPSRISVDPTQTALVLLRLLTVMAVFVSVFALSRQRENATLLLGILIAFFCFYAFYGLVRLSFSVDRIWWFEEADTGYLTSSFIGRSNAATYFGLGVVAATALLARSLDRTISAAKTLVGSAKREIIVRELVRGLGGLVAIWLLLLTALFLTGSRGGIVASLIALLVVLVVRAVRSSNGSGRVVVSRFAVLIALVIGVVLILEMSGAKFVGRMLVLGFEDINREIAAQATFAAAYDHLWTGAGAGSFQSIFPLYRPESLGASGFWNNAHQDYFEILLGLGLPGFLALVVMLASLTYRVLRGVFARRRDSHFASLALASTVLVGLHALGDFSLQIQGVALTYIALLALGVAQSQSSRSGGIAT